MFIAMRNGSFRARHRLPPDPAVVYGRYRPIIDDWPAFCAALARPLPVCLWANVLRVRPAELAAILEQDGVAARPLSWNRAGFRLEGTPPVGWRWWYVAGLAHCQEEVSMLPALLLDVRPGMRVLDLCAAPGGKTAQVAVALANRGTVVANDVRIQRLRPLRHTVERLGLVTVCTVRHDGTSLPPAAGTFDRVLVDAPCSAEGIWRKNTAFARRAGPAHSRALARVQAALLAKGVQLCRPGGRIVYSTCTFAPEENEAVVDALLRRFGGDLRLVPAQVPGFAAAPGLTRWQGQRFLPELAGAMRVWPHTNDTGGFFVAVLEKTGGRNGGPGVSASPAVEEPGSWRGPLAAQYGIPQRVLTAYQGVRQGRAGLYLAAADIEPPCQPRPDACGVFAYRTRMRRPRLTTAGALLLGRHAESGFVELDAAQVEPYFRRQDLELGEEQRRTAGDAGAVIVRFRGFALGMGLVRRGASLLESLFPKGWHGTLAGRPS